MRALFQALLVVALCQAPVAAQEAVPPAVLGPDGLWQEDWFRESTGDLRSDLALAAAEGRFLAIFWERPGCPYCERLHLEAFRVPELRAYPQERFYAIRLNRFGRDRVVGFDGVERTHADLALHHAVWGTPTVEFRIADGTEVFRLPGYAEPPVLKAAFDYVVLGGYLHMGILDWLEERGL